MSEVNIDPIGWSWNPNVDAQTLMGTLNNDKDRLVSLDVFFIDGKQRLAAVWIDNTGDQHQVWGWNPDVDVAALSQILKDKKSRLVVLAPFVIKDKLHLAAVWVSNTGTNAQAGSWSADLDQIALGQMLLNNNERLTTLSTYELGGKRRYAAVWVDNTEPHHQMWDWRPDVDAATLGKLLDKNIGRLVSLDPFVVNGKLRFAAVWVKNTETNAKTWWWYFGLDKAALNKKFDQFCAYPVDVRDYASGQSLSCVLQSFRPTPDPFGAKLIKIAGTGSLDALTDITPLEETLSLNLNLKNLTSGPVTITEGELLWTETGGWVIDKESLYSGAGLFKGQSQNIEPSQSYAGSKTFFRMPYGTEHFIVRLRAQDGGGKKQYLHKVIATPRSGFSSPPALSAPTPVFIGEWTTPAEVIPLWLGEAQTRWMTIGGQIINGSDETVRLVGWHLIFEADGEVVLNQALPMNFSHFKKYVVNGNDQYKFESLPAPQGGEMALTEFLAYFVHGFDVGKAPNPFSKGTLKLIANYKIGDRCNATVCEREVVNLKPVTLAPPITGRWHWGNSPDHKDFDPHAWPADRFAVDLVKVDENNAILSPNSEPAANKNYYAYGEPVLAMADGAVVKSSDSEDENFGNLANPLIKNINYIVLEHEPNHFTGYYHLRKDHNVVKVGDTVKAGQILAQVGNSGGSSNPHLHIGYVALDATGRGALMPMQFEGLRTTTGTAVTGVPASGVYTCGEAPNPIAPSSTAQLSAPRLELPVVFCSTPRR
jgi:Peptidase family M23/Bacterial tandem repeat domain 1